MVYTVVTGASKGIGKEIAKECARRNRSLILVSLPGENLEEVKTEFTNQWDIDVKIYETDLTSEGAVEHFFEWCDTENLSIDTLINNAGQGRQGWFEKNSIAESRTMITLNMEVVTSMSWHAIPLLKKQPESYIMNVGSIASYIPIPYKSVYAASKGFVLDLTNSLRYELRNSSISVSCLCPGPTISNQRQVEKIQEQGFKARLFTTTAEKVAEAGIKGMLRGKRVIIPGIGNAILARMSRLLPTSFKLKIAGKVFANSSFT